jgi:aspartyl-tRNA(Asn)/glutamyl-tRNA(Gln) amidotransferase subunit A
MQEHTAKEIIHKIKSKEVSAVEITEQCLESIKKSNDSINALLWLNEKAQEQARRVDEGAAPQGRLRGVPIVVKDNFCIKGTPTTAASRMLENFVAPYTAHCIQRLLDEGAILIGKSNMDEFAMGSSNENSYFGACKNPINKDHVPGGSSGGSAAAVAAGFAPLSVGSDTGGSIRQPASFCGVVGIKPTYGSISRYGMIAFASSLDQAGPMAHNVDDAALVLDIMIDKDPRDSTNVVVPKANKPLHSLKGCRVGLPKEYFDTPMSEDVKKALEKVCKDIKGAGGELIQVELPHTCYAIPVYYLVASSEASSNLSRYDGVRYGLRDIEKNSGPRVKDLEEFYTLTRSRGFGDEVKRRILLGTFSLSAGYCEAFYTKACQVRRRIYEDFEQAFQVCDLIIGPVSTDTAFKIGEKTQDPLAMYANDSLTTPASLAGLPSMSLPCGRDRVGLPIGLQIIAPPFRDGDMVTFAKSLEELIGDPTEAIS